MTEIANNNLTAISYNPWDNSNHKQTIFYLQTFFRWFRHMPKSKNFGLEEVRLIKLRRDTEIISGTDRKSERWYVWKVKGDATELQAKVTAFGVEDNKN